MGSVPNESCVSLLFRFTNRFSCCHHQTTHFLQSVIDFTPPNWSKTTKLKVDPLRMLEKIYMSVKKISKYRMHHQTFIFPPF